MLLLGLAGCGAFGSAEEGGSAPGPSPDASTPPSSEDGGSSVPCKDRPITSWSAPAPVGLVGPAGEPYFVEPFVTADGLTLYVSIKDGALWKIHRATRAARTDKWSATEPLVGFVNPAYLSPYPTSVKGDEVLAQIPGSSSDIGTSVLDAGGWSTTPIPALGRPDSDLFPSITADGVTLVYVQYGASADNPFVALFQATRAAPDVSSAWSAPTSLEEQAAGTSRIPPRFTSPALTPDGLGLFYGDDTTNDRVYYLTRKTRGDAFFTPTSNAIEIPALQKEGFRTTVRSMTADGCEAYMTSSRDGVDNAYVSKRLP